MNRDDPDDSLTLSFDESAPASPPVHPMDLEALSPEARLATALVMQAQALEGMRRSQADLVRRVSEGGKGEDGALHESLSRFHDRLDDVRQSQKTTLKQVKVMRRRTRWWAGVGLLVLAAAVALSAWWVVHSLPQPSDDAPVLAALDEAGDAQAAAVHEAVDAAAAQTRSDFEAGVTSLMSRIEALEVRDSAAALTLTAVTAERDRALEEADRLAGETSWLSAEMETLSRELEAAQDDRLFQVGENTRLRNKLLERERQQDELRTTIEGLRVQAEARPAPAPVETTLDSGAETLAERVNILLAASGALVRFAEVGSLRDGVLHDVLLLPSGGDPAEPPEPLAAGRAVLTERAGIPHLLLEDPTRPLAEVALVALPRADLAAWGALGLTVPAPVVSLVRVREAFERLLEPQPYRLVELASVVDDTLFGVVLEGEGRLVRADRARVEPEGPTLMLTDGTVTTENDERPFYRGVMRLPLPGSAYAAWHEVLTGHAP